MASFWLLPQVAPPPAEQLAARERDAPLFSPAVRRVSRRRPYPHPRRPSYPHLLLLRLRLRLRLILRLILLLLLHPRRPRLLLTRKHA